MDLIVLAVLVAFLAWGAFHGALRQLLGLVVLAVAFVLAPWLGRALEGTVAKLVDLAREDLAVVSWGVGFLAVAAAGGVILHAFQGPISRARIGGALDRWLGGAVGAVKGVVVVGLLAYAVMGWYADREGPDVVRSLRTSRSARWLGAAQRGVGPLLRLPPSVERRVEDVNRRIGVEAP